MLAVAAPTSDAVRHWLIEVVGFQAELQRRVSPSLLRQVDLDSVWRGAVIDVWIKSQGMNGMDDATSAIARLGYEGSACPLIIDELCASDFNAHAAVQRFNLARS